MIEPLHIEQTSEESLESVKYSLDAATRSMKDSCRKLSEIYIDNSIRKEAKDYRSNIYLESVMYRDYIYPKSKEVVSAIKHTLETYVYLEEREFSEIVSDMSDDLANNNKMCDSCVNMHTYILTRLKVVGKGMQVHINKFDMDAQYFQRKADIQKMASILLLCMTPIIAPLDGGLTLALAGGTGVAGGGLGFQAQRDARQALVSSKTVQIIQKLISCLEGLVNAIERIAEFMTLLGHDLRSLSLEVDNYRKEQITRRLKLHYKMVRGKASSIIGYCNHFISIAPSMESDLNTIVEKISQEHRDAWLKSYDIFIKENVNDLLDKGVARIVEITEKNDTNLISLEVGNTI